MSFLYFIFGSANYNKTLWFYIWYLIKIHSQCSIGNWIPEMDFSFPAEEMWKKNIVSNGYCPSFVGKAERPLIKKK